MNQEEDRIERIVVPTAATPDTQRNLTMDIAVGVAANQLSPVLNAGAQVVADKIRDVITGPPPAGKHAKQD